MFQAGTQCRSTRRAGGKAAGFRLASERRAEARFPLVQQTRSRSIRHRVSKNLSRCTVVRIERVLATQPVVPACLKPEPGVVRSAALTKKPQCRLTRHAGGAGYYRGVCGFFVCLIPATEYLCREYMFPPPQSSSAIVATTGAWSDGCSHLRGTRSIAQALQRAASAGDSRIWSMRRPLFSWKPSWR